jgi:hypothetical protein
MRFQKISSNILVEVTGNEKPKKKPVVTKTVEKKEKK